MNPFALRSSNSGVVLSLSAMMAVLGVLIAMAWITEQRREDRFSVLDPDQRQRLLAGTGTAGVAAENEKLQQRVRSLQQTVEDLQKKKTDLENAMSQGSEHTKVLNANLQDTKLLAGLTEVVGPGVVVTLRDRPRAKIDAPASPQNMDPEAEIIHDYDVLRTVNELWNAGAEAIAVNGNRIVSRTSIRCVGTVIHVNDQPVAPPIMVEAIGDPKTLLGAMNMRGNALEELRQVDEAMASVESAKLMKLPPYSGPQTRRWAKLPEETKEKGSK